SELQRALIHRNGVSDRVVAAHHQLARAGFGKGMSRPGRTDRAVEHCRVVDGDRSSRCQHVDLAVEGHIVNAIKGERSLHRYWVWEVPRPALGPHSSTKHPQLGVGSAK